MKTLEPLLSKEQRHQVYQKALVHYKSQNYRGGVIFGLCWAIEGAMKIIGIEGYNGDLSPYHTMEQNFPEVYKHKPKSLYRGIAGYWWALDNTKKRIAILEQAIKETK